MHAYFEIFLFKLYRSRFSTVNDRLRIYAMNTDNLADKVRVLFAALTGAHITRRRRNVSCIDLREDGVASGSTSGASTPHKIAKHHHKTFSKNENAPAPDQGREGVL